VPGHKIPVRVHVEGTSEGLDQVSYKPNVADAVKFGTRALASGGPIQVVGVGVGNDESELVGQRVETGHDPHLSAGSGNPIEGNEEEKGRARRLSRRSVNQVGSLGPSRFQAFLVVPQVVNGCQGTTTVPVAGCNKEKQPAQA
jgi:hypothetical protein